MIDIKAIRELCESAKVENDYSEPVYGSDTYQLIVNKIPTLLDELEAMQNAQRWIPVTERLPEERGYYLAVVKREAPDELGGDDTRVKTMRWIGEDWRYAYHIPEWINGTVTDTVTHWMPLPETPKGESHE